MHAFLPAATATNCPPLSRYIVSYARAARKRSKNANDGPEVQGCRIRPPCQQGIMAPPRIPDWAESGARRYPK